MGLVPGVIPFQTSKGKESFIVPAGAAWPLSRRAAPATPPPGYQLLPDWAAARDRNYHTARTHLRLGHIPEAIPVGRTGHYVAVPEGLPWPAKPTGRPRNPQPQGGAPGSTQGAGESLGAPPAREAA